MSFHWPLAGWLALACAAPVLLARWPRAARLAVHGLAALGLLWMTAYLALVASPAGRAGLAATEAYADNFSGWNDIAAAVRGELAAMPGATLVADNFMLGAQLSFALDRGDIRVLAHPLNEKHGRARQLADWGLLSAGRADWGDGPVLLVVEDTARPLRQRLAGYRALCTAAGALPPPRVLNVDQGRKRFLLFRLPTHGATCSTPALAWIDSPEPGQSSAGPLQVRGWALKEGVGVARVELTLDGVVVAEARYGAPRPDVLGYWDMAGGDPGVGFEATLGHLPAGRHWLGLVVHGRDGSVETWPGQVVRVP